MSASELSRACSELRGFIDQLIDEQKEACFAVFEELAGHAPPTRTIGGGGGGSPLTPAFHHQQVSTPGGDPALVTQAGGMLRESRAATATTGVGSIDAQQRLIAFAERLKQEAKARERGEG